jgi:hypothetical protein
MCKAVKSEQTFNFGTPENRRGWIGKTGPQNCGIPELVKVLVLKPPL